jgi:hypothetical protein
VAFLPLILPWKINSLTKTVRGCVCLKFATKTCGMFEPVKRLMQTSLQRGVLATQAVAKVESDPATQP